MGPWSPKGWNLALLSYLPSKAIEVAFSQAANKQNGVKATYKPNTRPYPECAGQELARFGKRGAAPLRIVGGDNDVQDRTNSACMLPLDNSPQTTSGKPLESDS